MSLSLNCALACGLLTAPGDPPAAPVQVSFARDAWRPDDFVVVKSPRFARLGQWVQRDDCVQNEVPADATPDEWQGRRDAETYSSLLYRRPVEGNGRCSTTLAFTHRMAPLLVLAAPLGTDAAGRPEYREHWEFCVFDQGLNIWHHTYADGQPRWVRAAYARFPLQPNTPYRLEVEVQGQQLTVRLAGHEFGYLEPALPARYWVGLTGCEGLNLFYDLGISGRLGAAP
ncbi:MAG: hypothetical protein IT204_08990 [Fimbriimonadaceae bacterium]|nr:hypothetical protein [Fimbriimonadaceae bacterium]